MRVVERIREGERGFMLMEEIFLRTTLRSCISPLSLLLYINFLFLKSQRTLSLSLFRDKFSLS